MEKLNTLSSYYDGFKIERNGEIIQLTSEEMDELKQLDAAFKPHNWISNCYKEIVDGYSDEEKTIVDKLKQDAYWLAMMEARVERTLSNRDALVDVVRYFLEKEFPEKGLSLEELNDHFGELLGIGRFESPVREPLNKLAKKYNLCIREHNTGRLEYGQYLCAIDDSNLERLLIDSRIKRGKIEYEKEPIQWNDEHSTITNYKERAYIGRQTWTQGYCNVQYDIDIHCCRDDSGNLKIGYNLDSVVSHDDLPF